METIPSAVSRAPARQRLLEAAAQVFYSEGIHAVPVDRVIAEAGVTRATFYRHFPGKEDLVHAYLQARDQAIRSAAAAAQSAGGPEAVVRALVDGIATELCAPGFRGCPFINAAAEYPSPDHPVHQAVTAHRTWFRETLTDLLTAMGHHDPACAADILVMLRDGAMVGGYLDAPDSVRGRLATAVGSLLTPGARETDGLSGRIVKTTRQQDEQ